MALIPSKLQDALATLRAKLSGQAEDATRERNAAIISGDHHVQSFAAGKEEAYADAAESARLAHDEAETDSDSP